MWERKGSLSYQLEMQGQASPLPPISTSPVQRSVTKRIGFSRTLENTILVIFCSEKRINPLAVRNTTSSCILNFFLILCKASETKELQGYEYCYRFEVFLL